MEHGFPVLFSFNLGPPWSCKLQSLEILWEQAWPTWHSQSLPRTSKSRGILGFWTWHVTIQHSFKHSSRHELIEATSLKCTHRTISNYLELCSNYVAGNVFFLKKWSSVSQDWPCFEGPASAIRKGEWEVANYQKKTWFAQCRAGALHPDTWEATSGICWTNGN